MEFRCKFNKHNKTNQNVNWKSKFYEHNNLMWCERNRMQVTAASAAVWNVLKVGPHFRNKKAKIALKKLICRRKWGPDLKLP